MKFNKKLLLLFGGLILFFLIQNRERFVNWTTLYAFDNNWNNNDNAETGFKATKTSELKVGCDDKRGTCIHY